MIVRKLSRMTKLLAEARIGARVQRRGYGRKEDSDI